MGGWGGKTDSPQPQKIILKCDYHKHVIRAGIDEEPSGLFLSYAGWAMLGKSYNIAGPQFPYL